VTMTTDLMYREIGKLFMETVVLRQALSEEQAELVRTGREMDTLRMRHQKLRKTALQQEENLIALNERMMGKKGTPGLA